MAKPLKLSVIYAERDARPFERLMTHLNPLFGFGLLAWVSIGIKPQLRWDETISQKFLESDIVLYLVSPDSLRTFCFSKELLSLKQHSRVIPVLLKEALWTAFPILTETQPLPRNLIPVFGSSTSIETGLAKLAKEIQREVSILKEERFGSEWRLAFPSDISKSPYDDLYSFSIYKVDRIIAEEISRAFSVYLSDFDIENTFDETDIRARVLKAFATARDRIAAELLRKDIQFPNKVAEAMFVRWAVGYGLISRDGKDTDKTSAISLIVRATMDRLTTLHLLKEMNPQMSHERGASRPVLTAFSNKQSCEILKPLSALGRAGHHGVLQWNIMKNNLALDSACLAA